jgi:hypothetical protein
VETNIVRTRPIKVNNFDDYPTKEKTRDTVMRLADMIVAMHDCDRPIPFELKLHLRHVLQLARSRMATEKEKIILKQAIDIVDNIRF